MTPTDQPAVALSPVDIAGAHELLVRSCEDCACPAGGDHRTHTLPRLPDGPLVRVGGLLELPLDGEHTASFSPHGNGGVVVLNGAGRTIRDRFAGPATVADVVAAGHDAGQVDRVATRLLAHDVLHPAGAPPAPRVGRGVELTAWLHVTNKCNLLCPYCYIRKSADSMTEDTGRQSVDALVRSATKHGFRALRLKYAGGEASLNAEVLRHLHDHAIALCAGAGLELSAVLLSNGVALSAALVDYLTTNGIRVMISLDGLGAAHDAQRPTLGGQPSSRLVLRTVDRLVQAGIRPHISVTITSRNVDAVASVVRFALERDLTFSFNFFRDNDCAATHADLQYGTAAMLDGLRAAFAVIEELLPPWSVLGAVLDRGQLLRPRRQSCGVGEDYVVIDQRGQISKCHMEIGDVVGDIRHTDPVAAIRDHSRGIRNLLVEEKEGCRDCTWRHWCSGGCAAATFRATGRFDVRSPNCDIYQAIYPDAVRLEGLRILRHAG
jgi:uncharacterized protein